MINIQNPYSGFGKWDSWYKDTKINTPNAFRYSETISYQKAADFLEDMPQVEDWGCGMAGFKNHCKTKYIGIDGSNSPFADSIQDLCQYKSSVDGIMMRHVLEHNYQWKKILLNAVYSFNKKMCLVIFTPFSEETREIAHNKIHGVDVPDISFNKKDITDCFIDCTYSCEENLRTDTGYGIEHIFYIKKNEKKDFPVSDKIAVITSIFGDYDELKDPCEFNDKADLFCFSDKEIYSKYWRTISVPYHNNDSNDIGECNSLSKNKSGKVYNMMASKYYKINYHHIPILSQYKYVIWVDAAFKIDNPDFIKDSLSKLRGKSMAILKHPERHTVKEEVQHCIDGINMKVFNKYKDQSIYNQYSKYTNQGFVDDKGLFACGFSITERNKETDFLKDIWWREIQKYTYQDQISFSYVLWLLNFSPAVLSDIFYEHTFIGNWIPHK